MGVFDFDTDHLSSVGHSCRYLRPVTGASRDTSEGISCSICRNWNGSQCTRREYDRMLSRLELD